MYERLVDQKRGVLPKQHTLLQVPKLSIIGRGPCRVAVHGLLKVIIKQLPIP